VGSRWATHRESGGTFDWAIYDRERLLAGNRLVGPAIVEEPAATTLVPPGFELEVDEIGNLIIRAARGEGGA
jgi:N-methylhydantoinase A